LHAKTCGDYGKPRMQSNVLHSIGESAAWSCTDSPALTQRSPLVSPAVERLGDSGWGRLTHRRPSYAVANPCFRWWRLPEQGPLPVPLIDESPLGSHRLAGRVPGISP